MAVWVIRATIYNISLLHNSKDWTFPYIIYLYYIIVKIGQRETAAIYNIRVPTLPGKKWKPGILSFTFPGLENALNLLQNCEKPGILTQNMEKNLYFVKIVFQDSLFKMSFSKKSLIYIFVISALSTQTLILKPNWPGISLHLHDKYMEFCVTKVVGTLHLF